MSTILVTGGTGSLGRPTVERLTAAGHDVRVLSRTGGPGRVIGDLSSGAGVAEAVAGVSTVVHLATTASGRDVAQTRLLLDACRAAGSTHLIYMSIVGVDEIPYPYYRAKFASEHLIEQSGLAYTILRATQFHSFLRTLVDAQRRLPVIFGIDIPDQPIAVEEVAARLGELVEGPPSGRVPDVGGPEQLRLLAALGLLRDAVGSRKPVWTLPLAGRTIRAFRQGRHMTHLPGYGTETFAEFVAREVHRQ